LLTAFEAPNRNHETRVVLSLPTTASNSVIGRKLMVALERLAVKFTLGWLHDPYPTASGVLNKVLNRTERTLDEVGRFYFYLDYVGAA
jgi:hypothetical protein